MKKFLFIIFISGDLFAACPSGYTAFNSDSTYKIVEGNDCGTGWNDITSCKGILINSDENTGSNSAGNFKYSCTGTP